MTTPGATHPPAWIEHADRQLIHAETHARPVPPLTAPTRVRRLAFMSGGDGADMKQLYAQMAALAGVAPDGPAWARQLAFERDGRHITWELHNEFATLTWTSPADDWQTRPAGIGLELHAGLRLVVATRLDLSASATIGEKALAGFEPLSLCYSAIFDGQAEAATDFRLDDEGFTRFEVAAGRCGALRCGVIVRRLLEIETYRCLALLGLPLARMLSPKVLAYEGTLLAIMQKIGDQPSLADHHQTLDALHGLSVAVGRTVEETGFRFAATHAYGEVLADRLPRLTERPIGEFTTIERYLNNRVQPALATCRAMEKRLAALTAKLQRSIELLDARISLSIQTQNQALLDTISDTSKRQYRLQETVEGLSIIAIAYYALGILGYVFEALHDQLPWPKGVLLGLSAPVLLLLVYFGVRRLRRTPSRH